MTTAAGAARQILLRGHEVISHTASFGNGRHCCLVFLLDPFDARHNLKVFKAYAGGIDEAESRAISQALSFLQRREMDATASLASRSCVDIAGRRVDIFCDLISDGRYQAFPFLRRPDGSRALIMQFHLKEAITGETPSAALDTCVQRIEEYFGDGGEGDGGGEPNT